MAHLHALDIVAVVVYFLAIIAVGIYSMYRSSRSTVEGYFLAGRFMNWFTVGASLFASNIGSEHFIGLAGAGAAAGIAMLAVELNTGFVLPMLGFVFLPVYIASGVCTLPEYMRKRFGGNRIRIYLASLSLLLYIFTKISVNLYSGGLFVQQALNWDMYAAVILVLSVTGLLTIAGGLTAVIYTDTLQAFCMILGAGVLAVISYKRVGGYAGLHDLYPQAIPNTTLALGNTTCGVPSEKAFYMLRDPDDPVLPWPAFIFGQTLSSIWYWCADQMMVQRALASKSLSHAQGGTIFAGFLKFSPVFLIGMPGMISRVLFPNEVGCADPDVCWQVCRNRVSCSNIAYPKLVLELMPTGMKGVMLSVMLAALMSDLTSIFNSASTLFTMDIYLFLRKNAKVRELMIVGRLFVVLMVVLSILWIPIIQMMQGGELFSYMVAFNAAMAPPIAAVYLCAIFWKRGNEKGAFGGLMVGALLGLSRKLAEVIYPKPPCDVPDTRPFFVAGIHYMYYSIVVFWGTVLTMVVISLATEKPSNDRLARVMFTTRFENPHGSVESQAQEILEKKAETKDDTKNNELEMIHLAVDKEPLADSDSNKSSNNRNDSRCLPYLQRVLNWFCGSNESAAASEDNRKQKERFLKITALHQSRKEKIILCVALITLLTCTTFIYIYFSFDGFGVYG